MTSRRKKMGRPRKPAAEKLSVQIPVKMTRAERRRIEAEARRLKLSIAATILSLWRERWRKEG